MCLKVRFINKRRWHSKIHKFVFMKRIKDIYESLPNWLKNKYILTAIGFSIWMLFFDTNNLFTHIKLNKEVRELKEAKSHFSEEMEKDQKLLEELEDEPEKIEKYAREKFLMKRKDEEVYIIK